MPITLQHQLGILTLAALLVFVLPAFAFAGSQNFTSSGTFTVPSYGTLTVTVNGAGGGGGGAAGVSSIVGQKCGKYCYTYIGVAGVSNGGTGGGSSFNTMVVGNGGGGGVKAPGTSSGGSSGSSGTASGGDTNTTGGGASGGSGPNNCNGYGGVSLGAAGGGGAGGRAVQTYAAGDLTVGAGITVTVGSGAGGGGGGVGANPGGGSCTGSTGGTGTAGNVSITWTMPSASRDLTVGKAISVSGDVTVVSNLTKGSGTFVIDNPANPENELLYHSFVESPDALNEYVGTAIIGKDGEAIVQLPDYFEALNGNYQYFVRPVDTPMGGLYVKQEVKDNAFVIAGGKPDGQVSWMVTGIRRDPYILANPIIPEVEKGPDQLVDKGEYLFAGNAPQCSTIFGCVWNFLTRWF